MIIPKIKQFEAGIRFLQGSLIAEKKRRWIPANRRREGQEEVAGRTGGLREGQEGVGRTAGCGKDGGVWKGQTGCGKDEGVGMTVGLSFPTFVIGNPVPLSALHCKGRHRTSRMDSR